MYILHTDPINHNLSEFGLINDLRKEMELIYQEEIDSIGITLLISEFSKNDIMYGSFLVGVNYIN